MLAFPGTLLAIAVVAARGPGLENTLLAVGLVSVPVYARLMRGSVLSLREREFVEAAPKPDGQSREVRSAKRGGFQDPRASNRCT